MQQYNVCLINISDNAVNTADLIRVVLKKKGRYERKGLVGND